jgi:hypothetical protein
MICPNCLKISRLAGSNLPHPSEYVLQAVVNSRRMVFLSIIIRTRDIQRRTESTCRLHVVALCLTRSAYMTRLETPLPGISRIGRGLTRSLAYIVLRHCEVAFESECKDRGDVRLLPDELRGQCLGGVGHENGICTCCATPHGESRVWGSETQIWGDQHERDSVRRIKTSRFPCLLDIYFCKSQVVVY